MFGFGKFNIAQTAAIIRYADHRRSGHLVTTHGDIGGHALQLWRGIVGHTDCLYYYSRVSTIITSRPVAQQRVARRTITRQAILHKGYTYTRRARIARGRRGQIGYRRTAYR